MDCTDLSQEEEKVFNKYSLNYSTKENEEKVNRQKYLFKQLKIKGIENSAIEKFLDITIDEIDKQYLRKEHFESKAGFLLALWGLLLGCFVKSNAFMAISNAITQVNLSAVGIIIGTITLMLGGLSLYFVCKVLTVQELKRFDFSEREMNFKQVVDDREITYVVLLEAYTNILEGNEKSNSQKSRYLKYSIIFEVLFVVSIVASYI